MMSDYTDKEVLDAAIDLVARWDDDKKYEFLEHRIRCMMIMRSLLQEREGLRLMLKPKLTMMETPMESTISINLFDEEDKITLDFKNV